MKKQMLTWSFLLLGVFSYSLSAQCTWATNALLMPDVSRPSSYRDAFYRTPDNAFLVHTYMSFDVSGAYSSYVYKIDACTGNILWRKELAYTPDSIWYFKPLLQKANGDLICEESFTYYRNIVLLNHVNGDTTHLKTYGSAVWGGIQYAARFIPKGNNYYAQWWSSASTTTALTELDENFNVLDTFFSCLDQTTNIFPLQVNNDNKLIVWGGGTPGLKVFDANTNDYIRTIQYDLPNSWGLGYHGLEALPNGNYITTCQNQDLVVLNNDFDSLLYVPDINYVLWGTLTENQLPSPPIQTRDKGYVLIGQLAWGPNNMFHAPYFIKTDSMGDFIRARVQNNTPYLSYHCIKEEADGTFVVLANGWHWNPVTFQSEYAVWLLKLSDTGQFLGTEEIEENTQASAWNLYPNPATQGFLTLEVKSGDFLDGTLDIIDMTGRVLSSRQVSGSSKITLNTEALSGGVYQLRYTYGITKDFYTQPFIVQP